MGGKRHSGRIIFSCSMWIDTKRLTHCLFSFSAKQSIRNQLGTRSLHDRRQVLVREDHKYRRPENQHKWALATTLSLPSILLVDWNLHTSYRSSYMSPPTSWFNWRRQHVSREAKGPNMHKVATAKYDEYAKTCECSRPMTIWLTMCMWFAIRLWVERRRRFARHKIRLGGEQGCLLSS